MIVEPQLSPMEAAKVSTFVYRVKNSSLNRLKDLFDEISISKHFEFSNEEESENSASFAARSGIFADKVETNFGFMLRGKAGTAYERHALIACRGTAGMADALTDLNASVRVDENGDAIHGGFKRTFDDFKADVKKFCQHNVDVVHFVGHSLGGALAQLAANYILKQTSNTVKIVLYTFGAPRVGSKQFAEQFTRRVGKANIHRVYHNSDPVSMIPLFPFVHAPLPSGEHYINREFLMLNHRAHFMANYESSMYVSKSSNAEHTWKTLGTSHPNLTNHCIDWLTNPTTYISPGLSCHNLYMLGGAINHLFKKSVKFSSHIASAGLTTHATVFDMLSSYVEAISNESEENQTMVKNLLAATLKMCYKSASFITRTLANVTLPVIKLVFGMLKTMLYTAAGLALSAQAA